MSGDLWPIHARQWPLLGRPLRPGPEDVAPIEAEAASMHAVDPSAPLRALLLGVTPEIATMRWPAPTELLAVDRCAGMIALVWPTSGLPRDARAVRGDWRALPAGDGSIDLAMGDGSLTPVAWPDDYRAIVAELRRVVRVGGRCVLRLFAAPREREDLAAVARDLESGRIASFHAFKWRLAMAVADGAPNVRLADVWAAWREVVRDPPALLARLGWPASLLATIDVYRDAPASYSFPPVDDVVRAFADGFVEVARHVPRYELGDRCPTLVFRRA